MTIQIHEILSGKKIQLKTRTEGEVGIYVCGVTVYDRCHIGHLRSALSFDAIVRYLEYAGYNVTYVKNFTDIDDKIIQRAEEIAQGLEGAWRQDKRYASFTQDDWALRRRDDEAILRRRSLDRPLALDVSEFFIDQFHKDFGQFNLREPNVEPKVSDHIPEIIDLIERIIQNGFGYEVEGDVYFDVPAYHAATGSYGCLSGRDYSQLMEGARVAPGAKKRNGPDFALWKGAKPGEPSWESPWGLGRPGWHIECSVMSHKYLGDGFDIHGGGKDLIFPHHENEIAQAEGGYNTPFATNWMHNGFVTVDGVKMSKSLGNFLSLDDALGLALPEVWKYLVLSVHYRSPIDFSRTRTNEEGELVRGSVDIAAERVHYFYRTLQRADEILAQHELDTTAPLTKEGVAGSLLTRFRAAMDDDFNTAVALSHMGETAKAINELASLKAKKIKKIGRPTWVNTIHTLRTELSEAAKVLGLFEESPCLFLERFRNFVLATRNLDRALIEEKITQRNEAKTERDFARADALRDELTSMNIVLSDLPGECTWDVKI